jgi:hypothetical protein
MYRLRVNRRRFAARSTWLIVSAGTEIANFVARMVFHQENT